MRRLQLYHARTRAKQTFVPADPSGRVALRDDSVDVYARAGDYIDQVISQNERPQQAAATPSGRATIWAYV
jgi:hypothetical protein